MLKPWYGNSLGGTVILVSGPSFKISDRVICLFNGIEVFGMVITAVYAACTSPQIAKYGRVPFHLYINDKLHERDTEFYSCESTVNICTFIYVVWFL